MQPILQRAGRIQVHVGVHVALTGRKEDPACGVPVCDPLDSVQLLCSRCGILSGCPRVTSSYNRTTDGCLPSTSNTLD